MRLLLPLDDALLLLQLKLGDGQLLAALAQLALPLRPGRGSVSTRGAAQRRAGGRTTSEAGTGRNARDASKEKVPGPPGHTGFRNR